MKTTSPRAVLDLTARYAARAPVYRAFCDATVETSSSASPAAVAASVAALLRP